MIAIKAIYYYMNILKDSYQDNGHVPIGSLLLNTQNLDYIIEWNTNNPVGHSELLVINKAYDKGWDLRQCIIFITCEPCSMCFNGLALCKIKSIFFGCYNQKFSYYSHGNLYKPCILGGFMEEYWIHILKNFFKKLSIIN